MHHCILVLFMDASILEYSFDVSFEIYWNSTETMSTLFGFSHQLWQIARAKFKFDCLSGILVLVNYKF